MFTFKAMLGGVYGLGVIDTELVACVIEKGCVGFSHKDIVAWEKVGGLCERIVLAFLHAEGFSARTVADVLLDVLVRPLLEFLKSALKDKAEFVSKFVFFHENGAVRVDFISEILFGKLDEVGQVSEVLEITTENVEIPED